jgi:hypothetical protein
VQNLMGIMGLLISQCPTDFFVRTVANLTYFMR